MRATTKGKKKKSLASLMLVCCCCPMRAKTGSSSSSSATIPEERRGCGGSLPRETKSEEKRIFCLFVFDLFASHFEEKNGEKK